MRESNFYLPIGHFLRNKVNILAQYIQWKHLSQYYFKFNFTSVIEFDLLLNKKFLKYDGRNNGRR